MAKLYLKVQSYVVLKKKGNSEKLLEMDGGHGCSTVQISLCH